MGYFPDTGLFKIRYALDSSAKVFKEVEAEYEIPPAR
jgi:hypothetical protein